MFFKVKRRSGKLDRRQRSAVRKAAALPPGSQALSAVYALGIRDGLRIARDIQDRIYQAKGDV